MHCTHKQQSNNNWGVGFIHDEFGTGADFINNYIGTGAWFIYDESGSDTWPIHYITTPLIPSAVTAPATSLPFAYPHAATICNGEVTIHL
jgi:hypothetical protein